jgi:hypothetical protein
LGTGSVADASLFKVNTTSFCPSVDGPGTFVGFLSFDAFRIFVFGALETVACVLGCDGFGVFTFAAIDVLGKSVIQ